MNDKTSETPAAETTQAAPKVEFPCDYPIKVIVQQSNTIAADVVTILNRYDSRIDINAIEENPSSKGNYVSIRFHLWATGESQLQALFNELKQNPAVKMVL